MLLGLTLAAKPADKDHPYGHGRMETLTGLLIGLVLTAGGDADLYSLASSAWAQPRGRWRRSWYGRWWFRWWPRQAWPASNSATAGSCAAPR